MWHVYAEPTTSSFATSDTAAHEENSWLLIGATYTLQISVHVFTLLYL